MTHTLILAADAYRMVDALKDYADVLDAESQDNYDMVSNYLAAAERIEMTERVGNGLLSVSNFDRDLAHSAVLQMMIAARLEANRARNEAEAADAKADRLEKFLGAFSA